MIPNDGVSSATATPRAIVAGHGDFAAGLVSAVEQITGRGAQLIAVAVQKLSVEDIECLLRERMLRVAACGSSSPTCRLEAARWRRAAFLRGMDDAVLIAGANLPMLLDFVFAEGRTAPEAARHAAERGRAAISVHGAGA